MRHTRPTSPAPSAAFVSRARADNFYEGKTINVICGYNPGGGVDLGTRLIAEHIGEHIPGKPKLVVQAMEGAGGLIAANHVFSKAAPDGLTLAVPGRGWLFKPLLGFSNARFEPMKFAYIGSTGATSAVAFVNAETGAKSVAELKASKRKILFGGLPSATMNTAVPRLLAQLGWPIEVIAGYENTSRIIMAMEQKELDAIYTPESSFVRRRDLLDSGRVVPVFQTLPSIPGVATADSLVEAKDRALMWVAHDQASVGMPLVAPPGTPPERVEILRAAFMAMTKTEAFKTHARRIEEPYEAPISGAELEKQIAALIANITPETVAAYQKL